MSSVWKKEVNNVFVHHECECTRWRYSKKNSNSQNTVKPTMNVFTENTVSEYLLQRSVAGFPKLRKKKKKKTAKTYTNTSDGAQKIVIRIIISIISEY